jgi:hypothetical protein
VAKIVRQILKLIASLLRGFSGILLAWHLLRSVPKMPRVLTPVMLLAFAALELTAEVLDRALGYAGHHPLALYGALASALGVVVGTLRPIVAIRELLKSWHEIEDVCEQPEEADFLFKVLAALASFALVSLAFWALINP